MEYYTSVALVALFAVSLPGLIWASFSSAVHGAPLGYLLGILLVLCLTSILVQVPTRYQTALWMFGGFGLAVAAIVARRG